MDIHMYMAKLRTLLESQAHRVETAMADEVRLTQELTEAKDALERRRAEILREYADPDGPHAGNGGIKALGSNEEARRAAIDGMVGAEASSVARSACCLAAAKLALDVARLWLQFHRDVLRTCEVEAAWQR